MPPSLTLGVLVSGEGTTLEALVHGLDPAGPVQVGGVIADRPGTAAVGRASRLGLPTLVAPLRGADAAGWAETVARWLDERRVDLVVLAGFLSMLPPPFLARWAGRVINVHPSLLPEYGGRGMYGLHVHEAVLRDGRPETGATVHLVTDRLDAGPILAQARLAVLPGETPASLRERMRPVEVALIGEVVGRFASGEWPLPYGPALPGDPRPARPA